jgi:ketosteroid isomerase-like protein
MTTQTEPRPLRNLLAKQEIHEVLMRYCRGIDRRDAELLHDVYHPDATDDHGGFAGLAADFVPWAIEALGRDENTSHYIANELVEVDGDVAFSESYFHAVHRRAQKDGTRVDLVFQGRYVDRFECREGRWRIADRKVVYDRSRMDAVEREFIGESMLTGKRSREDPVFRR